MPASPPLNVVAADEHRLVVLSGGLQFPPAPSQIVVLDARTGRERTRFAVERPEITNSSVLLRDGVLVLVEGNVIAARRLRDGRRLWTRPFAGSQPEQGAGLFMGTRQGRFGVIWSRQAVDTIRLHSGGEQWTTPSQWVAVPGPGVVVAERYRTNTVVGLDAATGRRRWSRPEISALGPGENLTGTSDGRTTALVRTCSA